MPPSVILSILFSNDRHNLTAMRSCAEAAVGKLRRGARGGIPIRTLSYLSAHIFRSGIIIRSSIQQPAGRINIRSSTEQPAGEINARGSNS